jgi:hypothetical protein
VKKASVLRAVAALAAVPLAAAGLSVPVLAGAVLVTLTVVAVLCWTITDTGRSKRLALLIDAIRRNASPQTSAAICAGHRARVIVSDRSTRSDGRDDARR